MWGEGRRQGAGRPLITPPIPPHHDLELPAHPHPHPHNRICKTSWPLPRLRGQTCLTSWPLPTTVALVWMMSWRACGRSWRTHWPGWQSWRRRCRYVGRLWWGGGAVGWTVGELSDKLSDELSDEE